MSDYVHETALRYPITDDDCDRIRAMENYMGYKHIKNIGYFDTTYTDDHVYLDYVVYHSYGDECGEWTKSRELYESEKLAFKHLFQQFFPQIDMSEVRLVDYCWYNCCEPPECYDASSDPFYKPIAPPVTSFISCYEGDDLGAHKCMKCGMELDNKLAIYRYEYCPQCGYKITWDPFVS